jgi:hypothetical protein
LRSNLAYDPIKDFAPVGMAVLNTTATSLFMGTSEVRQPAPTGHPTARRPPRKPSSPEKGYDAPWHDRRLFPDVDTHRLVHALAARW